MMLCMIGINKAAKSSWWRDIQARGYVYIKLADPTLQCCG